MWMTLLPVLAGSGAGSELPTSAQPDSKIVARDKLSDAKKLHIAVPGEMAAFQSPVATWLTTPATLRILRNLTIFCTSPGK